MKHGIRLKIVLLLAAMALVPLLAGLVVIVGGGVGLRRDSFRRSYLAVATSEAQSFKGTLIRDLRRLRAVFQRPQIVGALAGRTERLPEEEIRRIEEEWPRLSDTDAPLRDILSGPGAWELTFLRETTTRITEVFITDRHGQIVAATNKTSDFFQADEDWWAAASRNEAMAVIPPISFDLSSWVWSMDLCMPITDGGGAVVGVGKGVIALNAWFEELAPLMQGIRASVLFADGDGRIAFGKDIVPWKSQVEDWDPKLTGGNGPVWRVTAGGQMQAVTELHIEPGEVGGEVDMPPLFLVVYGDESAALQDLYRLAVAGLAIGLLGIGALFFGGLFLIDRTILRRVLRLAETARKVAGGDLSARARLDPDLPRNARNDEIGDLGADFDDMVENVELSHRQLAAADEMKRKFIAVAAHELRTPVSYIAGRAKLARDGEDPGKLREAVCSIGSRAEQLCGIVDALFKLLPGGALSPTVRCVEIEPEPLVSEVREKMRPFLEKRRQDIIVETAGAPPFKGDRDKLLDILENLLSNAIKFTPDGGTIRVTARQAEDGRISFEVADQGEGIPADAIPGLFEPFSAGGDPLHHSTGASGYRKQGIGLGLAIVRYFAGLHGGTVDVRSGPGGSTFIVTLPSEPPGRSWEGAGL
jgi:signal transduction histidine kinase